MRVKISSGFTVEVAEDGRISLPDREFTTSELKRVVREVNRQLRVGDAENVLKEVFDE